MKRSFKNAFGKKGTFHELALPDLTNGKWLLKEAKEALWQVGLLV